MSAPSLPTLLWTHWAPSTSVEAGVACAAGLYLLGVHRTRSRWPPRRTAAFLGGLGIIVLALVSGIGAEDDTLLSDHMVQHLLLLEVAPLLLLAGHPGLLALRAAPVASRRSLAGAFERLRPLTHPGVCLGVFTVVVLGTHVPAFYDATLRHVWLHELEHGLYLAAGTLMWWPVLDADPLPRRRLNGLGRLAYIILAMIPMTVVGAYLSRDVHLAYAPYAAPAQTLGISAIVDQQLGGMIMWVLGSMVMILAGLWLAMAAMVDEERRLQVRERHHDDLGGLELPQLGGRA
jgi:putative membrane protein